MAVTDAPLVGVVGAGIIGLSCAAALAARGARVLLIGESHAGESSPAAAGMLAPSIESNDTPARQLGIISRNRYPEWVAALEESTGVRIPLLRNGVIEIAPDESSAAAMRARAGTGSQWLTPDQLREIEPDVLAQHGALLHEDDGAVDNVALVEALRRSVMRERMARVVDGEVLTISPAALHPAIRTRSGRYEVDRIVVAAGAWVNGIGGLPARVPVEPVRGQMLAAQGTPVGHVVYAPGVYLVPRNGETLAGATMERVGFEVATTPEAQAELHAAAIMAVPALGQAQIVRGWAGLRPVTPDLLPIIDTDPAARALVYACGHSRNGILLAPVTGEAVASLVLGEEPRYDLTPFSIRRFGSRE